MEGIEIIFAILAALSALLIVIVIYKMGVNQKNVDLLKEQLRKERPEDEKGGGEFTTEASGMGAAATAATAATASDGDRRFHPSG
ncbi:MAG TPA: hypothetical protein ENI55_06270 [Alphaproteobacteria bacterium]|nr:hypothetical protein [Alphaproteobacteria bacterium]